jgi:hypothetical protein
MAGSDPRAEYPSRHPVPQIHGSRLASLENENVEESLRVRFILMSFLLLGAIVFGWLKWRGSSTQHNVERPSTVIDKQPVVFANRTFDPAAPPADMPPLGPGEGAECDSRFLSHARVAGESRQAGATRAILTVTQVTMTLQLNITVWVPSGAPERVIEHEDGHRQISEFFYRNADTVADRIAASYIGKEVELSGPDLNAASSAMLQQLASEIAAEYGAELNPGPHPDLL